MLHLDRASKRLRLPALVGLLVCAAALTAHALVASGGQIQTTINDFHQPGTQPLTIVAPIYVSANCTGCHSNFNEETEPYTRWTASMMAQAGRDPVFRAALPVANQDASVSGEWCLRCHAPGAWLAGRSTPADGSALDQNQGDFDGVTCHLCHRMVDPFADPAHNPPADAGILAAVGVLPPTPGNGEYIIDPADIRRGPFRLRTPFFFHDYAISPYHTDSLLCATCHDVSNPTLSKQLDGSYELNALDQQHPTHNKYDEYPIERTYSEWDQSAFARGEIEMNARFGGNATRYSTCQSCHMPAVTGYACQPVLNPVYRDNVPQHNFNGVNSWVLAAVRATYPDSETSLTTTSVADAHARNVAMQQEAVDVQAWLRGGNLAVRIVNQTAHKLPTGYGEGRRMWIHVRFLDAGNALISERGAYDLVTATLTNDTKIYSLEEGLDAAQSALTGVPAGPSFHFMLNNTVYSDDRIPPRGFTNAGFDAIGDAPVAYAYADEQYWDDSEFALPPGTAHVEVEVFHQTSSREYMEFLRDTNTTNSAGLDAYNQWVAQGQSEPVLKKATTLDVSAPGCVPPIIYGTPKTLSNGRSPNVSWSGMPSVSGVGFSIVVRNGLPHSQGVLRSSPFQASIPFEGGTLLLGGATSDVANFQLDSMGQALLPIALAPALIGQVRNYQAFFRDRGVPGGTAITNALHVEYCP